MFSGSGIANDQKITTIDRNKYKSLKEDYLSNNTLITTVQKLVAGTISKTLITNKTSIQNLIKLHNSINIVAGKRCQSMTGGFVLSDIKQEIDITSEIQSEKQNTIISDISKNINIDINKNIKDISSETITGSNIKKIGSTLNGIVDSAVGFLTTVAGTATKVLSDLGACAGIKNSCEKNITNEVDKELQNRFQLDNNFTVSDIINDSSLETSIVTMEDITNIIASIFNNNTILLKNVCPSEIKIANIDQTLVITNLIKNNTISTLSLKIATNYINNMTKIINHINSHINNSSSNMVSSDIVALGDATAVIIKAGGDAVAVIANTAGTEVSGGIDKITNQVGDTLSGSNNSSSSNTFLYVTIAIIIIALVGGYWYFKIYKKRKQVTGIKYLFNI